MKYRLLTLDELKELEPEFVQFLSSNQITANDWIALKEQEPEKVNKLIELFSDIVLDKVLKKVEYVEKRERDNILIFRFLENSVLLVGLSSKVENDIDFTNPASIEDLARFPQKYSGMVEYFKNEKKYSKSREEEVFSIINSGGLITDDKLFQAINSL